MLWSPLGHLLPADKKKEKKKEEEEELVFIKSLVYAMHCAKGYFCIEIISFNKLFITTTMREVLSPSPFYR